ncbi:hypothetical protein J3A83DRAFT_4082436, partial [Scleroderma citrinum]
VQQALEELSTCIIPIPDCHPTETAVVQSKVSTDKRIPTWVTIIHGGPHITSAVAFTPSVLDLALGGCTVSMPNNLGSMNFGEQVLGKYRTVDIGDCI